MLRAFRLILILGALASLSLSLLAPLSVPPAAAAAPAAGRSLYAGPAGARVHYVSWGESDRAIVLIHGWSGDTSFWDAQVPALAKRYRVIAVDMPGFGLSDKPDITYDVPALARGVGLVLAEAGVGKAVLVGHSMAFAVALTVAAEHPERAAGVVSVDGGVFAPVLDERSREQFAGLVAGVRGPDHDAAITGMLASFSDKLKPAARKRVFARILAADPRVAASAIENLPLAPLWQPVTGRSPLPVLGLYAAKEAATLHVPEWLESRFATVHLTTWNDVDHWPQIEHPARVNAAILVFAREVLRSPKARR